MGSTSGVPAIAAADLPEIPTLDTDGLTQYEVVRVVDGDTIVVDFEGEEEYVRLIGVDTPETKHPQKAVEYFGEEASALRMDYNEVRLRSSLGNLATREYVEMYQEKLALEAWKLTLGFVKQWLDPKS